LDLPLALVFFDALVNMGNKTATKLMQEALGEVPDGVIGPRTRSAMVRQGKDLELIVKYQAERGLYYASRGHFDRFGRGWLRRIIRTAMQAVELGAVS
jgi:lysozyme family protein